MVFRSDASNAFDIDHVILICEALSALQMFDTENMAKIKTNRSATAGVADANFMLFVFV